MKKVFLLFVLILSITTVKAFNIDVDKIDVNLRGKTVANELDSSYKIDVGDFDKLIVNDDKAVSLVKRMIGISISNVDEADKKSEYT